jgi:60 kDa SS-A/Ro ribonucleoprotein
VAFLQKQPERAVAQTTRANDREVVNNAGGYVYAVDDWTRLDRFLLIGSEGGTYYVGQDKLTDENTRMVHGLLGVDGPRVVARVVEISEAGRAVKQDYGLYVLALAASVDDLATRRAAYAAIGRVCRTASTLFQFVSYIRGRRGWSRGLRSAIGRWYEARPLDQLAYQVLKYPQRYGYTHRDLLRLSHADAVDGAARESVRPENAAKESPGFLIGRQSFYHWIVKGTIDDLPAYNRVLPSIVFKSEDAKREGADRAALAKALPREALPTEWLTDPKVWEALLYGEGEGRGMPLTALVRNLGNLSKCGLLTAGSDAARYVGAELTSESRLQHARIHPMAIYVAAVTYAAGRGVRGDGTWAPVGGVVDALEASFYAAMPNVEPTGKPMLVAIDSSGSMSLPIAGYVNLSARGASLAFALVVARTEPHARVLGFTDGSNNAEFKVAGDERLRDFTVRFNARVEGRGTDLAQPMLWATQQGFAPDAILVWTDSETWAGQVHADHALRNLRTSTGKAVRLVVAATTATGHSVADPTDRLALNVCGFDASVTNVIADFVRGAF